MSIGQMKEILVPYTLYRRQFLRNQPEIQSE